MKNILDIAKSAIEILRDLLIGIFIILIFTMPGCINKAFNAAGLQKAEVAGFVWQRDAAKAGGEISSAKLGVQDVSQALTELAGKTKDPAVQSALKDAVNRLAVSQASINSADQSIKSSVEQAQLAETKQEQPKATEGWVFLGHLTQDKSAWTYTNAHKPGGGDPDLKPGQLQTSDNIYMRAATSPGQHATGLVIGVIPSGVMIDVLEIDTSSHALSGGWFVWARVKTA
jgi:hypothetical protein